jgi:membrane protein involved in colicin uptake
MKKSAKLVLAALALASCAAGAETVYSGQSDQERRDRNREEALANYRSHAQDRQSADSKVQRAENSTKRAAHEVAESTRHASHEVAETTRHASHKTANAARHAGHKTAQEARHITARADAKFGAVQHGKANPEGVNPVGVSSASPTAPSNGVTK